MVGENHCKRGHDISLVGRNKAGGCNECQKERDRANYLRDRDKRIRKAAERQLLNGWKDGALKRAKERGFEIVEVVDPFIVFERDNGICQLCLGEVDLSFNRATHPAAATLDHTAPIHSYATVQLVHRQCNRDKGDFYGDGKVQRF